ncbi:MAG: trimethylamine methyltransferase family protein [Pseudomonadota bacterium]
MSEVAAETSGGQRRRRRRRGGGDAGGPATPPRSEAYRKLTNPYTPVKALSDDQIAHIHETALRVHEELGIRVLLPEARELFAAAGAKISGDRMVHLDRDLIARALETAPSTITLKGGADHREQTLGGNSMTFMPIGGPPHINTLDHGKRPGTFEDLKLMFRLCQHFDVIHALSPSVEPQDLANELRHLDVTRAQMTLSDKPPFVYARGTPQVHDCFEIIRLARGLSEDEFRATAYAYTVINSNSPRQLDIPMCQGLIDFARAGQITVMSPFTLSGAMAPVTMAGAQMLQHAEALAGITLSQLANPGAPVVYGSFTSNVDMKSGAPAFGTPEYIKGSFVAGQLARHIGLPWRSSNANASNAADEQAVYESMNSIWAATLGGANILYHCAGWLEGGLTSSPEKLVMDVEALQIMAEAFQPLDASDDAIGFEALREVEPGGHFFAASHTMSRYETAFYPPILSDWSNFGQWTENGGVRTYERANTVWKQALDAYEQPTLDSGASDAVDAFVDRRTSEGGAHPES